MLHAVGHAVRPLLSLPNTCFKSIAAHPNWAACTLTLDCRSCNAMQVTLDTDEARAGLIVSYSSHAFTCLLPPGRRAPTVRTMRDFQGRNFVYRAAPRPAGRHRAWGFLPVHIGLHWVRLGTYCCTTDP